MFDKWATKNTGVVLDKSTKGQASVPFVAPVTTETAGSLFQTDPPA